MVKAATYQCPNCNGVLAFDAETGMLECAHCKTAFSEGEVESAIPLSIESGAGDVRRTEHVTTVEGFLGHAPWEADGANAANAMEYSCPSCGAGVIAEYRMAMPPSLT